MQREYPPGDRPERHREPNVRNTGITIYFADGESTWDIAKQYATTPDNIKRFNPDMGDSVAPGQKVLIF